MLLWRTPKQLEQWLSKKSWFFVLFFINISERSRKLLFLISTTKTSHNCHMLKWSFFSRRSQDFLGSVRSAWRGECDLYPLSKCGPIRLHFPPPVQPYIACYFHVPEPFLREHLFFTRAVFMSWVGCQLEWLFSRLDRSSGRQRNRGQIGSGRNQLQLATRLFFTLPT